jgi:alpha-ketoglutarate-dependent taurine dioxygenase
MRHSRNFTGQRSEPLVIVIAWGVRIEHRVAFLNDRKLPAVIEAHPGESLRALLEDERESLGVIRKRHGAILLRGFGLASAEEFREAAALAFENQSREYIGGVSPRGKVMAGVYESTSFPAHLRIPQHNEMAYLPDPPRGIAFFCETEPQHGGETPLADARAIYASMDIATRNEFESRGISYHRYLYGPRWNLHDRLRHRIVPLHTSWMAAFATGDPAVVERCCAENGSKVEWDKEDGAKINNVLPAVRQHPDTGELLWFNQVSTFLSAPRSTGLVRWMLYQFGYRKPFLRPFHATFGDGERIRLRHINAVNEAIDSATVSFRWRKGDLLLLDNYLVTHGRMPYRGERRILVAIH